MEKIHTEGRLERSNKSRSRALLPIGDEAPSVLALVYPDRASEHDRMVRGRFNTAGVGLVLGMVLIAPFWLLVWAMWLLAGLWW